MSHNIILKNPNIHMEGYHQQPLFLTNNSDILLEYWALVTKPIVKYNKIIPAIVYIDTKNSFNIGLTLRLRTANSNEFLYLFMSPIIFYFSEFSCLIW